jgi:poly-gamma-glutamate capsule biosynthesis protein CapA/YwtB (metallophosphatase superfamily)
VAGEGARRHAAKCVSVRRLAVLALAAGFGAALAAAVLAGLDRAAATPQTSSHVSILRVDTKLPGWLAPGAAGRVGGFAGANERLRLATASGVELARTRSGRLGRFVFHFHAPNAGRYRLLVGGSTDTASAGTLIVRPLVLDAVGDITFGEQVGPALTAYGPAYPWEHVARLLRSADITVGNLETAVGSSGTAQPKEFTFHGPPIGLRPMASLAGFDALTLANNHSGDFGSEGLLETLRSVRASGIVPFGAGANDAAARRPAILEAGGLKVALLGYSDINPLGFNATASTPGTARADTATIAADVHAARRRADVVVCFLHWGVELRSEPDERQQQIATACLGAGADVVLGAHPHVLGPVSAPRRRSVVAWTLGNFVFPSSGTTARTGILQVHLGADGVRGFRLLPVQIVGFQPRPVDVQ